ncbi:Ger(x)C family spore germination protein [Salinibacillus xinjiangensis]|uniref:Ger(X)C family spore germination protein n=1 Tax=Salinibacillus xinjiangensis TaxID=1229268 RepID=A0A6G1X190_9BACI|nr:Ger(x)C family spore germination protein [Salinibacillus xinjiangensis]MRG84704.1 Ger(x)C family spore germination protein [Salinibacillus xinjiangensis]
MRKIPILLSMLLFITGCWDRYELEERANILGLAIDIAEEEDMKEEPEVTHREGKFPEEEKGDYVKVTAQISLPGKIKLGPEGGGGEGSEKNAWVLETVGHTVKDAMANLQQQLAEKLYMGHLQIIVISEDLAKRGVTEINDYFRRNPEVRRTAWMVVNEKDASKVLEASPPVETVPSLYLSETLDNSVRFGKLPREYLGKYWIDLSDPGVDAILPTVKVQNNDRILLDGMAYFKGEKMVDKFPPIEIGVYMSIKEKNPGGYGNPLSLSNEKGVYIVKATERKSKIRTKVENGKPSATIEVKVDSDIVEEVNANHLDKETVNKLEEELSKKAKNIGEEFIKKLKEDGSDVLGLGARIRAKYAKYWDEKVKTDEQWSEIYKDMDIQVNYEINIRRTGMVWK